MKCPSCGTSLADNARFCGVCGTKLATPPAAAVPPTLAAGAAAGKGGGGLSHTPPPQRVPTPAPMPSGNGQDPYIGQTLNNRFRIDRKLGEGGFGAVYMGEQIGIGRKVALKLLHPEMTRDKNLVARFRREGVVSCSLRDAHTVTTYDFDQTPDGTLYIAMELLEGRSLHDVFHAEAPIAWQRMLKILAEMCTSLAEAHSQGIVHRDLKPENIHLEQRPGNPEFVKILDFGIAKVMHGDGGAGSQSPQLTATGQTLGTLEYMSPEQLMGKKLDGRSDVYALGVLVYELTTGRLPFPDAVGPAALISAQLRSTPEPPSAAHPAGQIPPGVDAVVAKCLEKKPEDRFVDVTELRGAVEQVLSNGGQVPAVASGFGPGARPAAQAYPGAGYPGSVGPGAVPPTIAASAGIQAPVVPPTMHAGGYPQHSGQGYPQVAGRPPQMQHQASTQAMVRAARGPNPLIWVLLALAVIGAAVGGYLAFK